jgi:mannose-6-phosphate isomerase class I
MISIEQQQKLLLNVSNRLKKKINVYVIGGTAMMFLGFKDATLDIDIVFKNEVDREIFKEAIKSLGYLEMNNVIVYGAKKNQPQMFTLADERFDLFVYNVIDFVFSENMENRAEQIHQYGENLILKIADPHDIILMKCATDRLKDKDDARKIIDSTKIDWQILINEAKNQRKLGKEKAVINLGFFLEHLKNEMKINIPQRVLDDLWNLTEKQIKEQKKRRLKVMKA